MHSLNGRLVPTFLILGNNLGELLAGRQLHA